MINPMKSIISKFGILLLSVVCLGFVSCGNGDGQTQTTTTTTSALEVDHLLRQAETLTSDTVTVEGICTHICARGGGKLFLMGSDDTKTIRVEAGRSIGRFPQEVVNNIVSVKGHLVEQRVDEAYLVRWEEQVKSQGGEQHGENGAGCESEQKARGEDGTANTFAERIADYRRRIAERQEKEGKDYLSFYHIDAISYQIL